MLLLSGFNPYALLIGKQTDLLVSGAMVALIGFLIVFLVLLIIIIALMLISAFLKLFSRKQPQPQLEFTPMPKNQDFLIVAVITAAVNACLDREYPDQQVRPEFIIKRIQRHNSTTAYRTGDSSWI